MQRSVERELKRKRFDFLTACCLSRRQRQAGNCDTAADLEVAHPLIVDINDTDLTRRHHVDNGHLRFNERLLAMPGSRVDCNTNRVEDLARARTWNVRLPARSPVRQEERTRRPWRRTLQ